MERSAQHKLPDSSLKKRLDSMHREKISYSVPNYKDEDNRDIFSLTIFYGHIFQWVAAVGLGLVIILFSTLPIGSVPQYIDSKVSNALTEGGQITWELVEEWVNELRKIHFSKEN
ncbi:hypothetical protein PRVXT_001773 [Proteinivorax tanatarense]|uniref:Uncharacterized protein n=1 Tax=Proteinivorax tanatarense TaxID=1260629 RepID=A0AAU7VIA9_9FIRM